ncbi:MAG: ABC transporter substrate-binding protein [Candidatus Bathyarchaeia archaeon]
MAKYFISILLVILLIQGLDFTIVYGQNTQSGYPINGPRVDEILFVYHGTPEASVAALRKGDIDILSDIFRASDVNAISEDPNLNLTFSPQTHYCYVAFNIRNSPLNDKEIRKAIAHLVPRQQIANRLFEGITVTPMLYETSPTFGKWHNPDVDVYPYDPSKAKEILISAGYGWDENDRLIDENSNLVEKITMISPTQEEAPTSYEIAKLVVEEMKKIGIDAYQQGVAFDALLTKVLTERDFDMYFLCVSNLGRFPRWLYDYYHSKLDVQDGDNTPGVRDPELDQLLYKFRFESETDDEAMEAILDAQTIIGDLAARTPVYSRYQIEAYRKGWEGMIKHRGVGYFSSGAFWTYLNLHTSEAETGGTVKIDIGGKVRTLNPLYGTGAYGQKIITLIYDSLLASDPETGEVVPYLAEDWNVETLTLNGHEGQKIVFNLVKNATWQDGKPLTSKDVKFSIEYLKENKIPTFLPVVEQVIKVNAPSPQVVEVIMNGTSIFNLIDVGGIIIIPEHIWKDVSDWRTFQPDREPHPSSPGLTKMIGSGPFILSEEKPGEFWRLTANPNYFKKLQEKSKLSETEEKIDEEMAQQPNQINMYLVAIAVMIVLAASYLVMRRRKRESITR